MLEIWVEEMGPVIVEQREWLLNLHGSYDGYQPLSLSENSTWNVEEFRRLLKEARGLVNEHLCRFGDPDNIRVGSIWRLWSGREGQTAELCGYSEEMAANVIASHIVLINLGIVPHFTSY
jgi:hypothetical protein